MNWDDYFMEIAKTTAMKSKDPSTKVGAVIVDTNNRIVSTGYNGFPKNIEDTYERLENRETKLELTIHAEMNAIFYSKQDLRFCRIYVWPMPPCISCALGIIQVGISEVIAPPITKSKWINSCTKARMLFREADVNFVEYK